MFYLENNDCVELAFMVLFRNQRMLFWPEEFVPRGAAQPEGKCRMTKTTAEDFQTKP